MKTKYPSKDIKEKIAELYLKGKSPSELSLDYGYDKSSIHRWVNDYKSNKEITRSKNPGSGRPSKINTENGKRLLKIILKPASDYGFETDLWNTSRLQVICKKNLKIKISHMAIWRFLVRFEQSFKKVQKQYYETDLNEQENWKNETLSEIKKIIKNHRAILYFEDESNISLTPVMGKSWGPIGKKIVHKVTGNRGSLSAISAISNDGRLIFNVFDGNKRFNSDDIIKFLSDMLKNQPRRHLVVVMDRATCHRSAKTKKFIDSQKRLHVFYLPARSPQLNPDEQVWAHLKNHELKSHQKTNLQDLKTLAKKKLNAMAKDKKKVQGIFKRCDNASLYLH
jgi:transposase